MNKTKGFVIELTGDDRERAKRLAQEMGCTENRLYAELIHEGLSMREEMRYMEKLRSLGLQLSRDEVLAILDRAPDVELVEVDRIKR